MQLDAHPAPPNSGHCAMKGARVRVHDEPGLHATTTQSRAAHACGAQLYDVAPPGTKPAAHTSAHVDPLHAKPPLLGGADSRLAHACSRRARASVAFSPAAAASASASSWVSRRCAPAEAPPPSRVPPGDHGAASAPHARVRSAVARRAALGCCCCPVRSLQEERRGFTSLGTPLRNLRNAGHGLRKGRLSPLPPSTGLQGPGPGCPRAAQSRSPVSKCGRACRCLSLTAHDLCDVQLSWAPNFTAQRNDRNNE